MHFSIPAQVPDMMSLPTVVMLAFLASFPVISTTQDCSGLNRPQCNQQNWHLGMDRVRPSGVVVHGHANGPLHSGSDGKLSGNVHGSRVIGGPHNGAQTVGGGLNYQHRNGLHGGVDATHTRGQGNTYSATVGGSTRVGPGTLTVGGGASQVPGSSRVQGQVGATYSVPLH